ncbi:nuclear transport factor 2 family protein [Gramella jeungdoensis]|uniref:Nuclear transport factor 2 family protein n=1 Tax=Gramella jeungdoensis TaxID=708091 RepID=A0ABT0YXR0_9FLAO|nr:nuclear transport factor 2 family protein [Gramella jeungdoensis]MCM8568247.1 nuclear transport factor 2 family protein [Gramella jeungdoensis]
MKKIIIFILLLASYTPNFSQVPVESDLYKELQRKDSLLFKEGFDKCRISEFEDFISEDLEFYHDQGGLSTNKEDFLTAVRNNICGNPDKKPIRKLRKGSLKVFPLYHNGKLYGAIQKGTHDFFIKEPNKELYMTSKAKFTHVWLLENDEWILKRVLSYDHQNPE